MVAIYARQSIDKKDSISIESQIEYGKREAFEEEYRVYQDPGYSGKNTLRPAFQQMMQDIDDGLVQKVVVYRLDRISRSIVDFADFIGVLEKKGVSFVSATEKFDTSTPMGRAMLYIVVVFAQLERETTAERVTDNYYYRTSFGAWGGGPAPYGFELVRTVINGKKATMLQPMPSLAVVKRIFELYAKPESSLMSVQKDLIREGFLSKNGVNFDSVKLSSILKSPTYVRADLSIFQYYQNKGAVIKSPAEAFDGKHGCILVGKRDGNERKYKDVKDHHLSVSLHEGIIDSDTFLFCQEKLSKNRQIKNTGKGKHSWLTGLVHCGHCGYAFSVSFGKTKNGPIPYFRCSGRYLHHCCDTKQTHHVYDVEEEVESILIREAQNYHLHKEKQVTAAQTEIQQQMREIDLKIENLIASLESVGTASAGYINRRIEQLHAEKELLQRRFNQSLMALRIPQVQPFTADDWYRMSLEEKRSIAKNMIEDVILSADGVSVKLR